MRIVGTVLIVVGVLLLVTTGGLHVYGEYERAEVERHLAAVEAADQTSYGVAAAEPDPTATAEGMAAPTQGAPAPAAVPAATSGGVAAPTSVVASSPSLVAAPAATPTPRPALIRRIVAAGIDLDARVVEAPILDGEWVVPKFVAGHLEGTALPGEGSNVVLSGHVQSIASGNVFARIEELRLDDVVVLQTTRGEVTYVVREIKVVENDDLSVVQPTRTEVLTLITCTGTFNPLTRDYSHRTIVVTERRG